MSRVRIPVQLNISQWTRGQMLVNPFSHTTILQQTTFNIFRQKIENLFNWMDNLWLNVENIVTKREIACFEQFLLSVTMFSKSRLLQRRQKASIWLWGKWLKVYHAKNLMVLSENSTVSHLDLKSVYSTLTCLWDTCNSKCIYIWWTVLVNYFTLSHIQ